MIAVTRLLIRGTSMNVNRAPARIQWIVAVGTGVFVLSLAATAQGPGWRANPKVVEAATRQRSAFNYDESRVPAYTLPDPLTGRAGPVRTREHWKERRAEILDLFRQHVYGRPAGLPHELR